MRCPAWVAGPKTQGASVVFQLISHSTGSHRYVAVYARQSPSKTAKVLAGNDMLELREPCNVEYLRCLPDSRPRWLQVSSAFIKVRMICL